MREVSRQSITLQGLNRATLARQLLLERSELSVGQALPRLGGLQAQEVRPPFLALHARLEGFERADLLKLLRHGSAVRAPLMRATLHTVDTAGFPGLRATLQPALDAAVASVVKARDPELDVPKVTAAARELLLGEPMTMNELRPLLQERFPSRDHRAMGYVARLTVPLTIVPSEDDPFGYPREPVFMVENLRAEPDPTAVVRAHLAAFGPASAADVQSFTGLKGLKDHIPDDAIELAIEGTRTTFYDLPDAPRPDPETPAPARLLPDFDSVLLAHKDRTRILDDEHKPRLKTKNLRVLAVFLLDGRVAGTWTVERTKTRAVLTFGPFGTLPRGAKEELELEAERLLAFTDPEAKQRSVVFT
jgi:hypothetical protein